MEKEIRVQRRIKSVLLIMAAIFFLCSCAKGQVESTEKEPYVIGVVTKSQSSEYWMSVCSGMEKAAKDFGVSVMILSPDTETDDQLQKKMIDDLLSRKVDALAVSPIQSYDTEEYLKKANQAGVPVYSYDTKIMNKDIPYIGIDNEKAGRELAQYMAEALGQTGKVGIISGDLKQSAHLERVTGFTKWIQENTGMEIAFVESGYSNLQMSEKEINRLMEENPDIKGIFATSAVTALGIMKYMGVRPVVLVTVDAQQDALEAVANGGINALAAQSGYDIGYETICYIQEAREGKELALKQILPVQIVTKENVESFDGDN